jgi:hypothetical protein
MRLRPMFVLLVAISDVVVSTQPVYAAWLDNLSRGQNILVGDGLQLQGAFAGPIPNTWPALNEPFNVANWNASNFTTANFSYAYPVSYMPAAPGPTWSYNTPTIISDISPSLSAYSSKFVSVLMEDEQDITDPTRLANLKSAMTAFHVNKPSVLTYTNQWDTQFSVADMQHYMQVVQPDMLSFDFYAFSYGSFSASDTYMRNRWYSGVQEYRLLGLAGNDGTAYGQVGAHPIPCNLWTQAFNFQGNVQGYGDHVLSESEIRLSDFTAWTFGYKSVGAWIYSGYATDYGTMFNDGHGSTGNTYPTTQFYQYAETNRQSRCLSPSLVRLLTTDVRMKPGQSKDASGATQTKDLPDGVSSWSNNAGGTSYIRSITATNLGAKNDGLPGDVLVGYYKPLDPSFTNSGHQNDVYFMILNGLCDPNGSAADCEQLIHITFDFGSSGITDLLRLSRTTSQVEQVPLTRYGSQYRHLYYLDLYLDGGTGDLFKFDNGGIFVPEPGAIALLGSGAIGLLVYAWKKGNIGHGEVVVSDNGGTPWSNPIDIPNTLEPQ